MKTVSRMLGLALFGTLAAASAASAVTVNHSGTMCRNFNAGDVGYIDYVNGVRSYKASNTFVICPVVRPINTSNGAHVWVDFKNYAAVTTSCTLYSFSNTGTFLGSSSMSRAGAGTYDVRIPATGTIPTTAYGELLILCSIPGSSNGLFMGYDVVEN